MNSRILTAALAGAALSIAAPALAKPGGGHGGGNGGGVHVGAGVGHDRGVTTRTDARVNSRGPMHASDRAISRANGNSVLAGTVRTRALVGLGTGMTVRDTNGVTIGTVSRVLRSGDGTVRNVLVRSATGQRIIPLAPGTLSVSGGAVTTTRLATSHRRR
jgi:hypothetical protein